MPNILEAQVGSSCGVHAINNMLERPNLVSNRDLLEMWMWLIKCEYIQNDINEIPVTVEQLQHVLDTSSEGAATKFIHEIQGGLSQSVVYSMVAELIAPGLSLSGPSGIVEFHLYSRSNGHWRAGETVANMNGKRMIAHCPGHFFAINPRGNDKWQVRESIGSRLIDIGDRNALENYLKNNGVDSLFLES